MMLDMDDVFLAAVRISLLAQADDILLLSLSARGLQIKLASLENWCARNFILINLIKTIILIWGKVLLPLPLFMLGTTLLKVKTEEKYVGVNFRTDTQNMLAAHYKAKACTAHYCEHRIMAVEDMTGRLTPKELKELCMARVDCHLIHGCKITPDSEDVYVKQLSKVQISFIHHMLNLHPRSSIARLFTETGLMPLRVRRLLIILKHLVYFLGLPKGHYARAALDSSLELYALVELRSAFLTKLFSNSPDLQRRMANLSDTEFLKAVLYSRPNIALLAKLAHDVLQVFYSLPMLFYRDGSKD
ncbi:hypothetical protein C8R44DRAFT_875615 [Mycena epipterygia]|nr:hypothetical protein C8R44DRAFT_875615 [Mycena epipterygia]